MHSRHVYLGLHLAHNVNEPVTRLGITIKQYKAVPYGRTYFVTGHFARPPTSVRITCNGGSN